MGTFRDGGDRLGLANALTYLGVVRRLTGDYPGAARDLQEALGIARQIGSPDTEVTALNESGTLSRIRGDLGQARVKPPAGPGPGPPPRHSPWGRRPGQAGRVRPGRRPHRRAATSCGTRWRSSSGSAPPKPSAYPPNWTRCPARRIRPQPPRDTGSSCLALTAVFPLVEPERTSCNRAKPAEFCARWCQAYAGCPHLRRGAPPSTSTLSRAVGWTRTSDPHLGPGRSVARERSQIELGSAISARHGRRGSAPLADTDLVLHKRGFAQPAIAKIISNLGSPFGSMTIISSCENSGRSRVRTCGPSLVRRGRTVAGRGWTWPDVAVCQPRLWLDVA